MVSKNNFEQHLAKKGNKKQRYTLRKLSVGVVSVSVGTLLMLSNGAVSVSAEEANVADGAESELVEEEPVEEDATEETPEQEESANNEVVETAPTVSENVTEESVTVEEVEAEVTEEPVATVDQVVVEAPVEEDAPEVELPRPTTLRNERIPHGTTIHAEDFVTNLEDFPEGTTFEFYDYDTSTGTESITLDVSPNPVTRNERLVIRATHPSAEEPVDSFGFTVIIEAPEALEAPEVYDIATRKTGRVEGITPENAEEIRVYLPNDTEEYREARILSARPGTNTRSFRLALPENYTWEAGDEVRVTAVDADGNESEATVKTVLDSDELTQLTVDPVLPEAEVISGTVNPEAESVQIILPGGASISASVADDGTWSTRTYGNASSLTPGEALDVRVRLDGNTHTYENEVFVQGEVDLENSTHVLARLGFSGDRYYRNTITLVDEFGNPVEGLTEEDFNIDTFGGIVNFEADGNVYTIDTEYADELRPNHSLSIDEDGVIQIHIEEEVDTSALEDLIAEAEAISNEDNQYTDESFAALQDAIDDARSALGTVETPEDVTEAVNALQASIDGLEESPEDPEEPTDPEDDRIAELEERLAELEEAARSLEEQNAALEEELAALREELTEANESVAALEERLAELEARLAELEEEEQDDDQGQDSDQGEDEAPGDDQDDDQGQDSDQDENQTPEEDQDDDQDQASDQNDDQSQDDNKDKPSTPVDRDEAIDDVVDLSNLSRSERRQVIEAIESADDKDEVDALVAEAQNLHDDRDSDDDGERLPDTATAAWALGLAGLTSLLSGLGIKKFKK